MKPGTVQFTSTTYYIVLRLYHSIVGFPEQIIWYTVYGSTVSTHLHFYRCYGSHVSTTWASYGSHIFLRSIRNLQMCAYDIHVATMWSHLPHLRVTSIPAIRDPLLNCRTDSYKSPTSYSPTIYDQIYKPGLQFYDLRPAPYVRMAPT